MTCGTVIEKFIANLEEEPINHAEFESIQEFISCCSAKEIRSCAGQFATLCHSVTESLIATKQSVIGIDLMITAIEKLRANRSQLTSIHSDVCLLCLDSKCLNPALELLDADYIEINKEDNMFEAKHMLLYHYYGGMIYAALKNFERALHFFEIVLILPAQNLSPIAVEAYKKHIILALLIHGQLPENMLPKYTPQYIIRQRKLLGPAYTKLAHEYATSNYEKISSLIQNHSQVYERDENMGLVKQCLTQVRKRNIQRLTKTFLTLSLRDVANHVGLATEDEAQTFILQMIDEGDIFATINQRDGMVLFQDNPEKFDSTIVFQKLQDDMEQCMKLICTIKKMSNDPPF